MKATLFSLATFVVAAATSPVALEYQQCYGLNGKTTTYLPCAKQYSSQKFVSCCGTGDICLSSGLCLYEGARDSRGLLRADGCTDPTLKDSSCQPWAQPTVKAWANSNADTSFLAVLACSSGKYCAIPATVPALSGDEAVGDDCCDSQQFEIVSGSSLGKPGLFNEERPYSSRKILKVWLCVFIPFSIHPVIQFDCP
ncbi:uncharacterized protein BDR25DRAFT_358998 [Lindgomyces ingoldianus]|uniref:Uncharacterized protein n=1 Tax=Lindgomyces ingoldianus TaxID=673940 RepID=A0ACB6QJ23_9PLEO|nr:uncharacterized protein BDR25DRAFT_358998 [Lindgomyces ingoldianus]KAF2466938.1 hypothetical protein BDR25DRAFT_358998 [Lindgomyces ingoldianus]